MQYPPSNSGYDSWRTWHPDETDDGCRECSVCTDRVDEDSYLVCQCEKVVCRDCWKAHRAAHDDVEVTP